MMQFSLKDDFWHCEISFQLLPAKHALNCEILAEPYTREDMWGSKESPCW